MTSRSELREHLRAKYGSRAKAAAAPKPTPERAFVTHAESGRTVITAPLREVASYNPHYLNLTGRFVEADNPNRNGAYWTSGDLHLGNATVAGGPLNWLHQEHQIVGSLTRSAFEVGDAEVGNHIVADAVLWSFLFPDHHSLAIEAAADENLYYSMECISEYVECMACYQEVSYADYNAKMCCSHLAERGAVRRFKNPIFLGGAVIVPPVQPGWANADLKLGRSAAALVEQANLSAGNMTSTQALDLAAAVLSWANRD